MRIDYLRLPAFGLFTDETIHFAPDKGLHIIYGRNEAGKSTLLQAVSDALFGIPRDSKADFIHRADSLRIEAGLSLSDGTQLAFRRRKALKKALFDLNDRPLDEDVLARFTGGLTRSEFESMFGLDHMRLRKGGRELLEAGGSLAESLFSAASGLQALRRRLEQLNSEAGDLFKPRGSKQSVNSLTKDFHTLKQELNAEILTFGKFEELEKAYKQMGQQLEELERKIAEEVSCQQKLNRIAITKPIFAQRQVVLAELEELGSLPPLAPDSRERFAEYSTALRQAAEERRSTVSRQERLEQELAELSVPQEVLAQAAAIDGLQQGLGQYRQAAEELPKLQEQADASRQKALNKLWELDPSAYDLEGIERFRLPVHLVESAKELALRFGALETDLAAAGQDQLKTGTELEATRRALEDFGPLADTTMLDSLLSELNRAGDLEQARDEKLKEAKALRSSLEMALRGLTPWTGSMEDLAAARLPLPATVAVSAARAGELAQERRDLCRAVQELQKQRDTLDKELSRLAATGGIPTQADLQKSRDHRDTGWQLVRKAWLQGSVDQEARMAFAGDKSLAEAYEQSVAAADRVADELLAASDRAARYQALKEQKEGVEQDLRQREAELAGLAERERAFDEEWKGLWEPVKIEPRSPEEMKQWLELTQKLLEKYQQALAAERDAAGLEGRIQHFTQRLEAALNDVGQPARGGLSELRTQAEAFCQKALQRRGEHRLLIERLREQEAEAEKAKARLAELSSARETWQQEWQGLLQTVGLPPATTVQGAEQFFTAAAELLDLVERLREAEGRVEKAAVFTAAFSRKAAEAASQIGLDPEVFTADRLVETLAELSREATSAQAARREKERQLDAEKQRLAELDLELERAKTGLEDLMAEAAVQTQEELAALLDRQERQRELKQRLGELEDQLLLSGGGLSLPQLAAEVQEVELDSIAYQLERLEAEIQSWRQQKNDLHERFGVIKKEYDEKVEGSQTKAAQAAEKAQETLASLAKAAGRYLQLRAAGLILQRAVERYQEEYQDPVLKRAGRLFAQLTADHFQDLVADYDQQGRPVIKGLRGGDLVGVEGMSDGTQDQLYLALRLAAIENFLDQGEPLPFIADDLLVNFDDFRSGAALGVLAQLAERTQVILFTHHLALVQQAQSILPADKLAVHCLGEVPEQMPLLSQQLA